MNTAKLTDPWKSEPYPMRGDLYEYEGEVYVCKVEGGTDDKPKREPITNNWIKKETIK